MSLTVKEQLTLLLEGALKNKDLYKHFFISFLSEEEKELFGRNKVSRIEFNIDSRAERQIALRIYPNLKDEYLERFSYYNDCNHHYTKTQYDTSCFDQWKSLPKTFEYDYKFLEVKFDNLPVLEMTLVRTTTIQKETKVPMNVTRWCNKKFYKWELSSETKKENKEEVGVVEFDFQFKYAVRHGIFNCELTYEEGEKFIAFFQEQKKSLELELHTTILNNRLKEYKLIS